MGRPRRSIVLLVGVAIAAGSSVTAWQLIKRHYDQRTLADYRRLSQAFDSIRLPSGYLFVSKSQQGSDYPSSFPFLNSQAPTEIRVFRVQSRLIPTDIADALKGQGWAVDRPFECTFTARRLHQSLFVRYDKAPDPFGQDASAVASVPAAVEGGTGLGCPDRTWPATYVGLLLDLNPPPE